MSLVCDADGVLEKSTVEKLDSLMHQLHNRISCQCKNKTLCSRPEPTPTSFLGLLQVSIATDQ